MRFMTCSFSAVYSNDSGAWKCHTYVLTFTFQSANCSRWHAWLAAPHCVREGGGGEHPGACGGIAAAHTIRAWRKPVWDAPRFIVN